MVEFLNMLIPNVMDKIPDFGKATMETLSMIGIAGAISFIFGVIIGVILTVTRKEGILENKIIYNVFDKVINVFRSIPFIILLAAVLPLSRLIMGTAMGVKGVLVPLILGTVPFFSRQVEGALLELDHGIIEAAVSMGISPMGIIFRVYLKESIPAIARVTSITLISLIGLTAMAGAIGAGGLGDLAIRYGYQRYQTDVTYVTIILLLILVTIIQGIGNFIVKKTTH